MQSLPKKQQFHVLKLIKQEAHSIVETISIPKEFIIPDSQTIIYNIIRSGDIHVFQKAINNLQENEVETESLLRSAYEELKIRNVPISFEMQVCIEDIFLEQNIFMKKPNKKSHISCDERIAFIRECFESLMQQKDYDEVFHFIMKFIAKSLRILKKQLQRKQGFSKLPWEEIEFCLVAFIRAKYGLEEYDYLTRMVLNKQKILQYLQLFIEYLTNVDCKSNFEDIKNDFYLLKDIYSLNRILWYTNYAVSTDLDEIGKLVIEKALQVMGEYLKNTSKSRHISQVIENRLISSAPKQLKEILTSLRDSLSHTHSLAKRILIEQNEKGTFFKEIQNDLKKIGIEITVIILDLKYEICRTFLKKLTSAESQSDFIIMCEEVAPFWYEEIHQNRYETEEWTHNLIILKKLENEPSQCYQAISDFVNVKMKETLINENAYSNILNLIQYITENAEKNFQFVKNLIDGISNTILLEKQTVKESEQIISLADALNEFSESAAVLANKVFMNAIISGKKIKQIDRFNMKLSKIQYDEEIESIFKQIEHCMDDQKQIQSFRKKLAQKKIVHTTKKEILQKLYNGSLNDIASLIKQLKVGGKAEEKLMKACAEGRIEDLINNINNKVHDVIDTFVIDMVEVNFFMSAKYRKKLKFFFKNAISVQDCIIDKYINEMIKRIEEYLLNRLKSLQKISKIDDRDEIQQIAIEMIMLDICDIYSSITQEFDGSNYLDGQTTILVGKYLRNFLAHGDPLVEILEYDPRVSMQCHVKYLSRRVESLVSLEDVLFGSDASFDMTELKQRYSKGLKYVISQKSLFHEIECGNIEGVKVRLTEGADPKGLKLNGMTVLHLSTITNKPEIFKFFQLDRPLKSESICYIAMAVNAHNILDQVKNSANLIRFALVSGNIDVIKYILKRGFDVNHILDGQNNTALHLADKDTLRLLLKYNVNLEARNSSQRTALHNACEKGCFESVQELLNCGADVNAETKDQKITPLHIASMLGHEKIIALLLQKPNIIVNCVSSSKSTPLYYACFAGHQKCVKLLLGAKADANFGPETSLTIAAGAGHKEIVSLLLEHGIPPKGRNAKSLFEASLNGFEDIVDLLLKFNVNINEKFQDNLTALHAAAQNGHYNIVMNLIKHNAIIEAHTVQGHTPLFVAAHNGFINIVKLLLEFGASPNTEIAVQLGNYKPLHSASLKGNSEIVELLCKYKTCQNDLDLALCLAVQNSHKDATKILLANGANPKAFVEIKKNMEYCYTALHAAILVNNVELLEILLDAGAVFNAISAKNSIPTKETALHLAAILGHYNVAKAVLERNPNIVDIVNDDNKTPLFYAVSNGHKDMVQLLLEKAAEIEVSFLQVAVSNNHVDVVDMLLKQRNDLIALDENLKITSLNRAIFLNYFDIADTLIEYGARIEYLPEEKQYSPLHVACLAGSVKALRFLLEKGAYVDIPDRASMTPLHHAVLRCHEEIIKLLLEYGADCTKMNKHDAILHCAVSSKNVKIAEIIIEKILEMHKENFKEFINVRDTDGDTPLMWAAENGLPEMVKLFLKNGADVNLENNQNITTLNWAVKNGNPEVIYILIENGAKLILD